MIVQGESCKIIDIVRAKYAFLTVKWEMSDTIICCVRDAKFIVCQANPVKNGLINDSRINLAVDMCAWKYNSWSGNNGET